LKTLTVLVLHDLSPALLTTGQEVEDHLHSIAILLRSGLVIHANRDRLSLKGADGQRGRAFIAAEYDVDVIRREPRHLHLRGDAANPLPVPQRLEVLNLILTTTWAEWSDCSYCGREGIRRRFGDCTINILDRQRSSASRPYKKLLQYKDGVPCRSSILLPKRVRDLKVVRQRKSVTFVEPCHVPCPKDDRIITVTGRFIGVRRPKG
jgi:hypothetical protein